MDQKQYAMVAASLSLMTREQLADIANRIKLLTPISATTHKGKQEFGDRVVQAICDVMRKNNAETPSPTMLKKSAAYASAKNKMQDLAVFFESISPSKLVQQSILNEAISLLYFDLLNWQTVAISSHTILKQIHRIPATLHRHFPGYAQSGLLVKIVKGA